MKKKKVFHLNGNTGWFTVCVFLCAQLVSGIFWGGKMTATVQAIEKKVDSLAITVKDNRLEAKQDLQSLETRLFADKAVKRSA